MKHKELRKYCFKCKELTFRDKDDNAFICTGCGDKTPRIRKSDKIVNIDEVDESLLKIEEPVLSEEVELQYEAVLGRFHKLSEKEKQVIEWLSEGKTQEEVAEIMTISRGEVSTYLNRARTKLK